MCKSDSTSSASADAPSGFIAAFPFAPLFFSERKKNKSFNFPAKNKDCRTFLRFGRRWWRISVGNDLFHCVRFKIFSNWFKQTIQVNSRRILQVTWMNVLSKENEIDWSYRFSFAFQPTCLENASSRSLYSVNLIGPPYCSLRGTTKPYKSNKIHWFQLSLRKFPIYLQL